MQRALEHDRPSLLFELAAERLRAGHIARPGVTQLERLVAAVRTEATEETYRRLEGLLDTRRREMLDRLLVDDPLLHRSRLSWLRQRAVAITPRAILGELEKLDYLQGLRVEQWDVSGQARPFKLLATARAQPAAVGDSDFGCGAAKDVGDAAAERDRGDNHDQRDHGDQNAVLRHRLTAL